MTVIATTVPDIRSETGMQPGAIEFRSIAFRCPCGCGYESWLPVAKGERGWVWNGSFDAPSLTPSILQSGLPCKWHGYLTDGEVRPC